MASGVRPFSEPPAIMALASPRRIVSQASPMLLLLVAQAETVAQFGPFAPVKIDTMAGAELTIDMVGKYGLIRSGPFWKRIWNCSWYVARPPTPLPLYTPMSSAFSSVIFKPDWINACLAVATAKCSNGSVWRIGFRFM